MKFSRRFSVPLVLGICLASRSIAMGDDRPAAAIFKEYSAVEFPKRGAGDKDPKSVQTFRQEWGKASARQADLALELFRSDPDHEQVPKVMLPRWQARMMSATTAMATIAEIESAIPHFKDAKLARDASYMKAIATIIAYAQTPEVALPVVNDYIGHDPTDRRGALLLNGLADQAHDHTFKITIFKRLIAEFPASPVAQAAASKIDLLSMIGKPLEVAFSDVTTGLPVSIKGLKGKVVVIDFWATWCGPCVAEMPKMKQLYAQYRDQGVEFIGVSLDLPKDEGGLDKLKAFIAKNQIGWPQYYLGDGWESGFARKMAITSIPQVFLVDAQGCLARADARGSLETLIPEYLVRAKKGSESH